MTDPNFMPMLAAGGWESLLTLAVIAVLSVLNNWLSKRKQEQEARESQPLPGEPFDPNPPPYAPTPTARPMPSWEEELRKMLQGDPAQAPAPSPPPIPQQAQELEPVQRDEPSRWQRPPPPPSVSPETDEEGPIMDFPPLRETVLQSRGSHLQEAVVERLRVASQRISQHDEAQRAMQRADHIDERINSDARASLQAAAQPSLHSPFRYSPDVATVIRNLQSPVTARQAVIASLIFSPPKALEM